MLPLTMNLGTNVQKKRRKEKKDKIHTNKKKGKANIYNKKKKDHAQTHVQTRIQGGSVSPFSLAINSF